MPDNAVLGPHKANTLVQRRVLWCLVLHWCMVRGEGAEKKCACHLIGTQATDIVSRDEQWPHTSPTHYLLLLLLAYHLRLLLDFLYPPMAHNLP